ncbi:MAG: hypothetical protein HYV09_27775 [Deltaproteobacteria bacterium]|nr:hypothetical protein [Deltaproteobacteria bacterium]
MDRLGIAKKRTVLRRLTASLCAISIALAGAPAMGEPTASDKETARALMKDGEAKRAKGDHKGAYEAYRAAHAIMNVPTTGLELGREQAELGMLVEARDTLLGVTRLPVIPGESANMPAAREEAQKLADAIEPRIPSLKIVLENLPAGASPKVTVDGIAILAATIGVPRKHNPGAHEVVVVVGSVEKKTTVDLPEGETKEVSIDVAADAGKDKDEPKKDEPPPKDEPPAAPPPAPTRSSLVWIGFGSAAAFGAIGAVTGVLAFSKASAAKDGCDGTRCPPATHDDVESSRTFGTISTIGFALAGAGAVVGFIGLMSSQSEGERPAPTASRGPSVGVFFGATGVGLSGAF